MIIVRRFHTYKDDFPVLCKGHLPFHPDILDKQMTALILDLSDLAPLAPLTYITRHTNDKIPPDHLTPFIARFPEFVAHHGKDKVYNIPTIWFVGHFPNHESIAIAREKLDQKNLKYFDDGEQYDSFYQFNQNYWEDQSDAELFVKFIHHTTMIGIDLLRAVDYKENLCQLGRLEYMQYPDTEIVMEEVKSDLKHMERYLRQHSQYYRENIVTIESEYKAFWRNFTKWKRTDAGIGSWPHFLFNTCGISFPLTRPPLKVTTREIVEV